MSTRRIPRIPGFLITCTTCAMPPHRLILAPCLPCNRWHIHGAGMVTEPIRYAAGEELSRAHHCVATGDPGYVVVYQGDGAQWRPRWMTQRGRLTASWGRDVASLALVGISR